MPDLIALLLAYLVGSVSFAVVVSRFSGLPDPHSYGSGNPGATNVLRSGNKRAAALTLLGDGTKGFVVVFLVARYANYFGLDVWTVAGSALAVFLGHLYPVFHRFAGGKGVATAGGVMLAIDWRLGLAVLGIWAFMAGVLRISSLAAIVAAIAAPGLAYWLLGPVPMTLMLISIALLLIWRHRGNMIRLLSGKESKIGR